MTHADLDRLEKLAREDGNPWIRMSESRQMFDAIYPKGILELIAKLKRAEKLVGALEWYAFNNNPGGVGISAHDSGKRARAALAEWREG